MSIYHDHKKINKIVGFVVIFLLVLALFYAIGVISLGFSGKKPIVVSYTPPTQETPKNEEIQQVSEVSQISVAAAAIVASKKGTKYHFSWCPGAKTISEANKIFFASVADAEKAGYSKAANCKDKKP